MYIQLNHSVVILKLLHTSSVFMTPTRIISGGWIGLLTLIPMVVGGCKWNHDVYHCQCTFFGDLAPSGVNNQEVHYLGTTKFHEIFVKIVKIVKIVKF